MKEGRAHLRSMHSPKRAYVLQTHTLHPRNAVQPRFIVTGRSPHATGTSRLHSMLTAEHETIVDALGRAGYYTGAFRKVHLGESFQLGGASTAATMYRSSGSSAKRPSRSTVLSLGRFPRLTPALRVWRDFHSHDPAHVRVLVFYLILKQFGRILPTTTMKLREWMPKCRTF